MNRLKLISIFSITIVAIPAVYVFYKVALMTGKPEVGVFLGILLGLLLGVGYGGILAENSYPEIEYKLHDIMLIIDGCKAQLAEGSPITQEDLKMIEHEVEEALNFLKERKAQIQAQRN